MDVSTSESMDALCRPDLLLARHTLPRDDLGGDNAAGDVPGEVGVVPGVVGVVPHGDAMFCPF